MGKNSYRKLSGIGTEFNFKNYPVRSILSFFTFAHYNWNLHDHYFTEKNSVQKGFLYVTEYSKKIQLTKQQKATIEQPPTKI